MEREEWTPEMKQVYRELREIIELFLEEHPDGRDAVKEALISVAESIKENKEVSGDEEPTSQVVLRHLKKEARELQAKIRAKYPMEVPKPWPEELKEWQSRLWQLGREISKIGSRYDKK